MDKKMHKIVKKSKEKDTISKLNSIYLDEKRIDTVTSFKYVGSIVRYDGSNEQEIETRIMSAKQRLYGLRNLLRSNRIDIQLKTRFIKIYIMSVLFFNCVGWLISPKIERFGNICESYIHKTVIKYYIVLKCYL